MIKHDRFSRKEYALDTLKKDTHAQTPKQPPRPAAPHKKTQNQIPPSESLRDKKTAPRVPDSAANTSRLSRGSRLEDLCEEDKSKIG